MLAATRCGAAATLVLMTLAACGASGSGAKPEDPPPVSTEVYPSARHDWIEIYAVPDGFGDVTVPGLERVTPNLFVGDTRESAPPSQAVGGETGSFQLVNDVPPSTA